MCSFKTASCIAIIIIPFVAVQCFDNHDVLCNCSVACIMDPVKEITSAVTHGVIIV